MNRGAWRDDAFRPAVVAAVVAAAFTVLVVAAPFLRFAYDNLSLHVALETSEALIGALLAYLVFGRYRTTGQFEDLALAGAFTVLAFTNLLLSAVPVVALEARPVGFVAWASAGLRLAGAAVLCAAATGPRRRVRPAWRSVALGVSLVVAAVVVLAAAADVWLADAIDPSLSPSASTRPHIAAHPAVLGIQLVAMVVYGVAALGFIRRAASGDELLRWLGAGAVVAAFARVHYFLFPSLYSDWVYTGDLLRLTSYLLFLVGAVREIRVYWEARAALAALKERDRLARDLHDGLVQDLSFLRSQTAGAEHLEGERLAFVAAAADRAFAESRSALEALSSAGDQPLDVAVRRVAEEVAHRAGATIDVVAEPAGDVRPAVRRAMLGIVREATTNAVRHGGARSIRVELAHGPEAARLVTADDGSGFDPSVVAPGFGLRSMRERARLAGGSLEVRSTPGGGTVVAATFPLG